MDFTIKFAITELPNFIVARIIHEELLVSTMGTFPPPLPQLVICNDFHLGGATFYLCTLIAPQP